MILILSPLQREDGPARPHGSAIAGGGTGTAPVLVTGTETETDAGVAHAPLTGGVQGEFLHCLEYLFRFETWNG